MQAFRLLYLSLLLAAAPLCAQSAAMRPVEATTEMQSSPVGIGTDHPAFGWELAATPTDALNLRQSAYRIVVAASREDLTRHHGTVWDSGRVEATTYWQRPYAGPALKPRTVYYWQVQVWSGGPGPGPWSDVNRFTTALLTEADWTAHWIAAEPDLPPTPGNAESVIAPSMPPPLPVFRHDFAVRKPVAAALLSVSGLGQYEVHLNGKDVTDTVLNPGWTNYRKTAPFNTYDVTALLRRGGNAFGVLLGNGMYNVEGVKGRYTKFTGSFGQPKLLLQLDVRYTDGTSARFVSDKSWRTHAGPVLYSSTYGGETYDAAALPADWDRAGFHAEGWSPSLEVSGPGGKLAAQRSAPMVVAETYKPVRVSTPKPGVTVYDLGENMSGWPTLRVRGTAGTKVDLLAGELLNPDGTVSQWSAHAGPDDPVLFRYILRGGAPESWHPRFAYYSFRYVQVTTEQPGSDPQPEIVSLAGDFVHARAPVVGEFTSSNTLFNRTHTLIDRAVLSNLASVVTDCPSREKLGWLEQTYLNASTLMLNYDVSGLYEKMADDMLDAQLPDGLVPSTAPEYVAFVDPDGKSNAFRDSPEWGSAMILSPWALYRFTGDRQPLEQAYEGMKRYAAYLKSRTVDGMLNFGLGDWYDIGPKEPGPSQLTSRMITATGVYNEDLQALAHIATLLGHPDDAAMYTQQAAAERDAYNARLFHPETELYDRGSQTAQAFPLALGLVPPEHVQGVLAHLVADIHAHQDHVTAGDVGFHYVVRALTDYGRSDVLAAMLSRTDSPSYGYQLARGATTLTEAWDANPTDSQNHFMLGHGEEWFYRGLAGLIVDMAATPEDAITFKPSFLEGVASASASYRSAMGLASIAWTRTGHTASVELTVPAGAQAHLKLPSGKNWRETAAGHVSHIDGDQATDVALGSGTYKFATGQF